MWKSIRIWGRGLPVENKAVIASVVDEGGKYILILGKGDHSCDRWELTPSLVAKLAFEMVRLALRKGN
jgi:hypothetical protein